MFKIEDFLNVRYSTRNLSDEYFETILDDLSLQLEKINYHINYSEEQLLKDWNKLKNWKSDNNHINSTSRIGMKLCESFFPNFYEIENRNGVSFANSWNAKNLKKVLRWNRRSHSTPYLSELKRGIYFCAGLTKNTMYRPQMSKNICMKYKPKVVFDPCAGWGGRMLGVIASGAKYIGFEPNTKTYKNLQSLIDFLNIQNEALIVCDDALNANQYNLSKVDMILTSPPYFDVEIYCREKTQSINNIEDYDSWIQNFLNPIIHFSISILNEGGVSCWNVGKVNKNDMRNDVEKIHKSLNFKFKENFDVISSKRQALQKNEKRNEKNLDRTETYIHESF